MTEQILYDPNAEYAWTCLCGNTVATSGFHPCTTTGQPVEEDSDYFVCNQCAGDIQRLHARSDR